MSREVAGRIIRIRDSFHLSGTWRKGHDLCHHRFWDITRTGSRESVYPCVRDNVNKRQVSTSTVVVQKGMPSVTERTFFKEDSIRKRAEQIFNLPANAGEKEVKNAYRRLVAKHHPDRNPSDTLSNQKMQLILQAYEVLRNKPAYDGGLNRHSLLEDDRLVKSILPEGVEPEPLGQPYEEWHRKQFYEGYFY